MPHEATKTIRIPVTFQLYGRTMDGHLSEVDGKKVKGQPTWWWLHSEYLINVLLFLDGELRWKNQSKELTAQIDFFREALVNYYQ